MVPTLADEAVPSLTVQVKAAYPAPLASAAGRKVSLLMLAALTTAPLPSSVSPTPRTPSPLASINSSPAPGAVTMVTDCRVSPLSTSLKPKSAAVKVCALSSLKVLLTAVLLITGASFTAETLRVMVPTLADEAVPSLTVQVKAAYPAPLASAAGRKVSLLMSAALTTAPLPSSASPTPRTPSLLASINSSPAPGAVTMVIDCRVSPLSTSLKPKSAAVKVCALSSLKVLLTAVLLTTGASFTGVILNTA
ncbi:Uncharacterised protein [Comamonas aquatica]|nr:Uncharacterised protein [Comamonas aquatica]